MRASEGRYGEACLSDEDVANGDPADVPTVVVSGKVAEATPVIHKSNKDAVEALLNRPETLEILYTPSECVIFHHLSLYESYCQKMLTLSRSAGCAPESRWHAPRIGAHIG